MLYWKQYTRRIRPGDKMTKVHPTVSICMGWLVGKNRLVHQVEFLGLMHTFATSVTSFKTFWVTPTQHTLGNQYKRKGIGVPCCRNHSLIMGSQKICWCSSDHFSSRSIHGPGTHSMRLRVHKNGQLGSPNCFKMHGLISGEKQAATPSGISWAFATSVT